MTTHYDIIPDIHADIDRSIFLSAFGFVAIDGSRLDPKKLILIG
jgi:hypothetical protein